MYMPFKYDHSSCQIRYSTRFHWALKQKPYHTILQLRLTHGNVSSKAPNLRRQNVNASCRRTPNELESCDSNQLHTLLAKAVAAEQYEEASLIKAQIQNRLGSASAASWLDLDLPPWLAERVAQIGYPLPTDIQMRSCMAFQTNRQCVIQAETGSGKTLAFLLPLLSRLDYPPSIFPEDLLGPQLIVVVPSMELGAQIAMLVYKIFGGNVNSGIPGSTSNIFAYTGPRNLKVRGLLNEEEVLMAETIGYLKAVHVLIAVPEFLAEVLESNQFPHLFHDLRAFAIDEVDACFEDHTRAMQSIIASLIKSQSDDNQRLLTVAGATVSDHLIEQAAAQGWLQSPSHVESGEPTRMPQSLLHRFLLVEQERKALVLCRQLRADLDAHGEDAAPPRVIVFAETEDQAVKLATPLRNSLWGVHRLAVLLPHGEEPLQMLQAFRDNSATIMLATPAASLGLDLPGVTHVYNLACPDESSYIHRAGRVGRIGSEASGVITSIVTSEELKSLQELAVTLSISLQEIKEPASMQSLDSDDASDVTKKQLEDIYNLMQADD